MRQQGSRYAIRAGRNLPDKEFRYLRMVIVTTAVYWGLNSPLRLTLTGPLNLPAPGRRQSVYINFNVFARTCVFNKQSLPSLLCDHHQLKTRWSPVMVPLLPKLRGHFAEFLNHSSPARLSIFYLTTCVGYGYGPCTHIARGFSRQHRITSIPTLVGTHHASPLKRNPDLPRLQATRLHHNPISGPATNLRHPIA